MSSAAIAVIVFAGFLVLCICGLLVLCAKVIWQDAAGGHEMPHSRTPQDIAVVKNQSIASLNGQIQASKTTTASGRLPINGAKP